MAKWYSGTVGAYSFPTFVWQVKKNPEKTSPRKPVPTWDRTRARCVTGAHATAWPTVVDTYIHHAYLHTYMHSLHTHKHTYTHIKYISYIHTTKLVSDVLLDREWRTRSPLIKVCERSATAGWSDIKYHHSSGWRIRMDVVIMEKAAKWNSWQGKSGEPREELAPDSDSPPQIPSCASFVFYPLCHEADGIYMQSESRRFTGSIGACSKYYFEQLSLIKFFPI